jgi:hypothetical protein
MIQALTGCATSMIATILASRDSDGLQMGDTTSSMPARLSSWSITQNTRPAKPCPEAPGAMPSWRLAKLFGSSP